VREESSRSRDRDLVWVETPFGEPAPRIVVAAARAGAFGVLDLGADGAAARRALEVVTRRTDDAFGVRVSERCPLEACDLPEAVDTVVVADAALAERWASGGRRVVAEVRSADEARAALAAGVDGLVAKGSESGGRAGTAGAFVLGQQVRALTDVPLWVQGGIGRHTAAAAVVGGATGVVVDAQVALLRECDLPRPVRSAVAAMDGSETRVVGGHRVYTRPDLWVAGLDGRTAPDDVAGRLGASSLTEQALPAGQDAALASGLAERYGTVGALVAGLRREIAEHIDAAREVEPLAPGHGVSQLFDTRYPVVQGPMTRVSDRAAFASAVADGGGMPFLALALLRAPEVRPLLEETARLLGERSWGVGVLGFVPKELRDEQLEVIREVRPPLALIAGGRPSQATVLEEVGIRTFLHVPAPGLLQRFLKDGARRFVFEGFECGGHVGPRSSFALWESQIEVLLAWGEAGGRLDELDVLFAGGIHDERSAAMVAAMAGPLAAAGARVGVLMGTAYLFTEEAVAAGAIGEEFQAQALACERTSLLESGPGHATRCAESPFVDTFEDTRRRLLDEGADPQAAWAELEGLNLGRLRVASKGLKREGDELVTVERDEQRSEGMFMIGDVATLRSERTTVANLHDTVSAGGTRHLAAVAPELTARLGRDGRVRPEPEPVDVAIVGMACVMPGANDVDEFWRNIVEGVNSITEVPPERWDVDRYFDPFWDHQNATKSKGSASKWGGFLDDIAFDAFAYGIPPASLAAVEPTQLLSLKVAADALADAGYAHRSFDRNRASVIFGAEGGTDQSAAHGFRALFPAYAGDLPPELDAWLPHTTEDSFPGLLTNVIAGRIANRLDLGGKNLTVDAACASSLAAVDAACAELAAGGSDLVLCGGADLHNGVQDFLLFTSVHALSTTGQCKTFDESADGIALGEGVACLALKRVADAERDGDRIYAVIKGVGASSDGRSLGLTAPRQDGQERAVRRAYEQAGVEPRSVGLVEAHGTGTTVGDRTELSTLTEVFTQAGMGPAECVVGSVKSNIGHTKCAAGLAGMIKAAKAVYHGVRPPTLNVEQPNRAWDPETSPFVFLDEVRPWPGENRVAGVSAFGFGGTNFHVVIESHRDDDVPDLAVDAWPAELFVFRGDGAAVDKALAELADRLAQPVVPGHTPRLRDVAAAVSAIGRGPVRLAIVADDLDDLRTKVGHAREGKRAPGVYATDPETDPVLGEDGAPPKVAFLFPGQGSQRPGMASDLFSTFAETRPLLDLGERWAGVMLPPAVFDDEQRDAQRRAVTDTRVAQPALGLADLAAATVLGRFGIRPDMVAGHSYGELVALCVAGALDQRALLALSEARAEAMLAAVPDGDPGGMVAVAAPRERLDEVLHGVDDLVVANDNHPEQLVVAGPTPAIEEALGRLKDAGVSAKRLPVACAFHSPVVGAASETLARYLDGVDVTEPRLAVFSNLTADLYPADARKVRDLLSAQVANGVRFTDEVRAMYDAGARVFVEVGPGRTLTGCVERILGDRPHVAIATDRPGHNGVRSLLQSLARLLVSGVQVDVAELFEGRSADATRWTQPAAPARWTINGHLVRTTAGDVVPGGLQPATTVPALAGGAVGGGGGAAGSGAPPALPARAVTPSTPVAPAPGGPAPAPAPAGSAPADQVLVEYFRAAHEIIGAGHDLVLNYLGFAPATARSGPSAPAFVPQGGNGNGNGNGATAPAALAPAPVAPAAPAAPARTLPGPDELLAKLTAIVSARTGYPEDMLGPDMDVEADLSIDSIKRLEILGELADEIGLTDDGSLDQLEDLVEELAARKTLRGIVDFLQEHADRLGTGPAAAPAAGAPVAAGGPAPAARALPSREELLVKLTAIVSARTGYPEDMLGPDLDVEADLSIDSIKRLEILGELADEIGLTDDGSLDQLEDLVEELAARKTLRGIVDFLHEHADRLDVGTAPAPAGGAAVAAPAGGASPRELLGSPDELLVKLTAIVSARTGYPEDMLGPDLDVEADLSIDSIKRLEILGELADEIGLTEDGSLDQLEDMVEELASRKTLRGVVDFLFEHVDALGGEAGAGAPEPATAADAAAAVTTGPPPGPEAGAEATAPAAPASDSTAPGAFGGAATSPADIPPVANRFVVTLVDAPLAGPADVSGLSVRVTGTGPVAAALAAELAGRGAQAGTGTGDGTDAAGANPAVTVLADLLDGDVPIPELYARIRPVLLDTASDVVVVSPLGGGLGIDPPSPRDADGVPVGAGARGLVKTVALEFPDRRVRLVDVDPAAAPDDLARTLADEVAVRDAPVEVAWREGRRRATRFAPRADLNGHAGLRLAEDSVVLLTGGARGITARTAVALAKRWGSNVELVGRSPLPEGDEDPELAACPDRLALRSALITAGWREPKAIEAEVARILAGREVRGTLAALAAAGSQVTYHQVDVRDAEALGAVVDGIYERHGRLDGIVHGAGVNDDHFVADKAPEAFERVFATKVDAARTLLTAVRRATGAGRAEPAFVAFFGSIAGVCGNRGQVDYAAANDALDAIAAANADLATRVVAVDWGPWSTEAGMVDESLAKVFLDSGMGLIDVEDGTGILLDEIAVAGSNGAGVAPAQVTVARCSPDLMAATMGQTSGPGGDAAGDR
jgi:acyl transferase domain-containing protein/NAD(P)H-dependent flavin oxidoreductase YrpB (nitropropane dioxygenase family)/NADP-dependent 3-hydroxy acid dehydrogenase YdfG